MGKVAFEGEGILSNMSLVHNLDDCEVMNI
jgi:hypothetical protein